MPGTTRPLPPGFGKKNFLLLISYGFPSVSLNKVLTYAGKSVNKTVATRQKFTNIHIPNLIGRFLPISPRFCVLYMVLDRPGKTRKSCLGIFFQICVISFILPAV